MKNEVQVYAFGTVASALVLAFSFTPRVPMAATALFTLITLLMGVSLYLAVKNKR